MSNRKPPTPQDSEPEDYSNMSPLRADEFLTYKQLMARLPPGTSRDAIRKLVKDRGLPIHRIGLHRMIYVRELIAASAVGDDQFEDDDLE